ncbi:5'-methylthioadenosine nucleosidase [Pleionea sediminis]|uniref:phosphorylase family protein n=1 Tax=Pleionea sediminis TaxID=2569479 RepID=UPI0011867569|nr:5'-methylthioadenosine nucleosidase [Pleionea sediminis]
MSKETKSIQHIVVLMAMAEEADPIIQSLKLTQVEVLPANLPFQCYQGQFKDLTVSVVISGVDPRYRVDNIGTQAATLMSHVAIENLHPDLVISAGTAGGFSKRGATIGTVYLSNDRFIYHDRRVPLEGFDESAIGHYPALNVLKMAKDLELPVGVVSTGSSLEKSEKDVDVIEQYGAVAKEMEAAAIAWVCWLHQKSFVAVKSITNLLDEEGTSEEQFVKNLELASAKLSQQLVKVIEYCNKKSIFELAD